VTFELGNPEEVVESEIANRATQKDVALTLALAMRCHPTRDWPRMMKAVNTRWPKGRERVLGMAWALHNKWLREASRGVK
jgi:hypothetical protein